MRIDERIIDKSHDLEDSDIENFFLKKLEKSSQRK